VFFLMFHEAGLFATDGDCIPPAALISVQRLSCS
jgi:hypothetical protein